jgi:hypothetical protein
VIEMRHRLGWWPMPTFEHGEWLWGLTAGVALTFLLSPLAFRGARAWRPLAYFLAGVMLLNGLGHTLFTILGRTVESVHFPRPAPGFWSSPLLIASALWMFWELRRTRKAPAKS